MSRRINQALWEAWRLRLDAQSGSGLTITSFCAREGISPCSFHAWKRKLRGDQPPLSSKSDVPHVATDGSTRGARRQPTRLSLTTNSSDFLPLPLVAAQASPWIEVALVDGTIVRVPPHNIAALTTVLRFVRGQELGGPEHA